MTLVAALVVGSGMGMSSALGPKALARGRPAGSVAGAWFCPHGGGSGTTAWVVITNPGTFSAHVRMTGLSGPGAPQAEEFDVPAGRQVMKEVAASDDAASTEVEYFGGWVGAAAVVRSEKPEGVAAERCVAAPHPIWYLPDETTGQSQNASIVVMNPFAVDAAFDVVVRTEQRVIRPGVLSPYVLPAGRSAAIDLNQFALAGPGEDTVTAEVRVRVGRAVAGSVATTANGIRAEAGIPFLQERAIMPGSGYLGAGQVAAMNPRGRRSDLAVVAQGASTQELVGGPEGLSIPPAAVQTFPDGGVTDSGLVVQATNHQPVAVARRLAGPKGDQATITPVSRAYRRWLLLPTMPPDDGEARIVIENPGKKEVHGTILLIGPDGSVAAGDAGSFSVGAGRTVTIVLDKVDGPVSAVVSAGGGTVVVGGASYSLDGSGYAATLGLPMGSG